IDTYKEKLERREVIERPISCLCFEYFGKFRSRFCPRTLSSHQAKRKKRRETSRREGRGQGRERRCSIVDTSKTPYYKNETDAKRQRFSLRLFTRRREGPEKKKYRKEEETRREEGVEGDEEEECLARRKEEKRSQRETRKNGRRSGTREVKIA
ncbi:hypothetical protein CSUI_003866, partial [Cystoisospora suis]